MDYNEALIRTATLNGIVLVTFTPLLDLSEVVLSFLPADERPDLETTPAVTGTLLGLLALEHNVREDAPI